MHVGLKSVGVSAARLIRNVRSLLPAGTLVFRAAPLALFGTLGGHDTLLVFAPKKSQGEGAKGAPAMKKTAQP